MKKLIYLAVFCGTLFVATGAQAQFRSVPAAVTDSFKAKYPGATAVSWSDKLLAGSFQATVTEKNEKKTARFGNKGEWQWWTKKITKDGMPGPGKGGLRKSKNASPEWGGKTVTMKFL